jgi:hypothetical protein
MGLSYFPEFNQYLVSFANPFYPQKLWGRFLCPSPVTGGVLADGLQRGVFHDMNCLLNNEV